MLFYVIHHSFKFVSYFLDIRFTEYIQFLAVLIETIAMYAIVPVFYRFEYFITS